MRLVLAAVLISAQTLILSAQTKPEHTISAVPPCPTVAQQHRDADGKREGGMPSGAAQPVEKSIILPSAGEPPANRPDSEVRAAIDCPMAPDHPNAMKPGDDKSVPGFAK